MAATPHDSTGTTFSFGGTSFTVTNIVVTNTDPTGDNTIDVSHLGQTVGSSVLTQTRPLKGSTTDTGRQVVIDYLGSSIIQDSISGTLILTISGSAAINTQASVTTSVMTLATNDVVKGQVTFKVGR
jgi:hypothetical protein